jgi:hypothetical protein
VIRGATANQHYAGMLHGGVQQQPPTAPISTVMTPDWGGVDGLTQSR